MKTPQAIIVEDHMMLAAELSDIVMDVTGGTVTTASSAAEALERVKEQTFDFALLDISLPDGSSFPVADVLLEAHIPYVFVTGKSRADVPYNHRAAPVVQKPYREEEVRRRIIQALLPTADDFGSALR